jgi:hypothetical protein
VRASLFASLLDRGDAVSLVFGGADSCSSSGLGRVKSRVRFLVIVGEESVVRELFADDRFEGMRVRFRTSNRGR